MPFHVDSLALLHFVFVIVDFHLEYLSSVFLEELGNREHTPLVNLVLFEKVNVIFTVVNLKLVN